MQRLQWESSCMIEIPQSRAAQTVHAPNDTPLPCLEQRARRIQAQLGEALAERDGGPERHSASRPRGRAGTRGSPPATRRPLARVLALPDRFRRPRAASSLAPGSSWPERVMSTTRHSLDTRFRTGKGDDRATPGRHGRRPGLARECLSGRSTFEVRVLIRDGTVSRGVTPTTGEPGNERVVGFDVARSAAMLGMIVVHFSLVAAADRTRPACLAGVSRCSTAGRRRRS